MQMYYGVLLLACKNPEGRRHAFFMDCNQNVLLKVLKMIWNVPQYRINMLFSQSQKWMTTAVPNFLFMVDTSNILTAVSMVHKCNSSCQFVSKSFSRSIERENIYLLQDSNLFMITAMSNILIYFV